MQRMQVKPPLGIVFDGQLGRSMDEILALTLLHGAEGKNESRVIGVALTNTDLEAAVFADALARLYLETAFGGPSMFLRQAAIGLSEAAPAAGSAFSLKPSAPTNVRHLNDTADPVVVIRNALTAQHDGNAAIVLAGPATNLQRLLAMRDCKPLIKDKVRFVVAPEQQLTGDALADWPTPIIVVPAAGLGRFPADALAAGYDWAPNHPTAEALKAMPQDAPAVALAGALYAVRSVKAPFTVEGSGSRRRLTLDSAREQEAVAAYVDLVKVKPEPRRRFRPPVAEDAKPEPPKAKQP